MSQILLFTNNPLNEQSFEERLRQLGHEVFTTKRLIDLCLLENTNHEFIRIFQQIILSETIANAEVKELVRALKAYSIPLFRKSDEQLEEAQLEEWEELGITDWIESCPSIEVLREKLSGDKVRNGEKIVYLPKSESKRPLTALSLSSGELKLFQILYEYQKQTVSRQELCLRMWNRDKTNSSMSQLSVMVKHLKNKLTDQGIKGPIIETCWGQGYRLDERVYEQVYIDSEGLKYGNE
ncbi:helix-turn-helix domain-containing protein [Enterococcus sp. DIV0756]|uniref:helix-turn-helix domain-containing protein n=1 Tax=Enterococcus sp. DIV0756 TaxID=2774636 RepID=UPI003F266EF9